MINYSKRHLSKVKKNVINIVLNYLKKCNSEKYIRKKKERKKSIIKDIFLDKLMILTLLDILLIYICVFINFYILK